MKARYDAFADDFVRGMKRMTEGLEVYKHMLRAFTRSGRTRNCSMASTPARS